MDGLLPWPVGNKDDKCRRARERYTEDRRADKPLNIYHGMNRCHVVDHTWWWWWWCFWWFLAFSSSTEPLKVQRCMFASVCPTAHGSLSPLHNWLNVGVLHNSYASPISIKHTETEHGVVCLEDKDTDTVKSAEADQALFHCCGLLVLVKCCKGVEAEELQTDHTSHFGLGNIIWNHTALLRFARKGRAQRVLTVTVRLVGLSTRCLGDSSPAGGISKTRPSNNHLKIKSSAEELKVELSPTRQGQATNKRD